MIDRFSQAVSRFTARPLAFVLAVGLVVVWALSGPIIGFNDTWQLLINTTTTVITFLMVFVLQHTQHKDTTAIHLKLDELVSAVSGTDERVIGIEDADDETLEQLEDGEEA